MHDYTRDSLLESAMPRLFNDCNLQVVLEAKGETQLRNLSSKLEEAGIRHKLWMEQPENVPTCLAAAPYRKSIVQAFFKKYKLCGS